MDSAEHVYFKSRKDLRNWLKKYHESFASVWVVFDKGKNDGLSYEDIVEVALCYGWIDSRAGSVDEHRTKLYISKRKAKSSWSESNKIRAGKLVKSGEMKNAGYKAIEAAQENGMWK
jgi:uncharacterized protein YdeI (YjbR/CyaY-like superfamily)